MKVFGKKDKKNQGNIPNLIIIGAQKCGTTSLHYYLNQHPDIQMSALKETQFFHEEYNWSKGIDWYKTLFPGSEKIHGEACTTYSFIPVFKNVAEKIYNICPPDVKLIYLVRDPIERAISSYIYNYKGYGEHRPYEQVFADPENVEYIIRGKYYYQLEEYLKYFNPEQIMVVSSEQLDKNRIATLKRIFKFLGVDPSFETELFFKKKNENKHILRRKKARRWIRFFLDDDMKRFPFRRMMSEQTREKIKAFLLPKGEFVQKPVLSQELREKMISFFKDDVNRLRAYTGEAFKEWKNFI